EMLRKHAGIDVGGAAGTERHDDPYWLARVVLRQASHRPTHPEGQRGGQLGGPPQRHPNLPGFSGAAARVKPDPPPFSMWRFAPPRTRPRPARGGAVRLFARIVAPAKLAR